MSVGECLQAMLHVLHENHYWSCLQVCPQLELTPYRCIGLDGCTAALLSVYKAHPWQRDFTRCRDGFRALDYRAGSGAQLAPSHAIRNGSRPAAHSEENIADSPLTLSTWIIESHCCVAATF